MEILRNVVFYLHLIGFALLLGGSVAQYLSGKLRINAAMLGGAVIQVVTGLILAAPFGLDPGAPGTRRFATQSSPYSFGVAPLASTRFSRLS